MQLSPFDFEDDYHLIGIHAPVEDYKVAFLINKHLSTKFTRFKECLDFENSEAKFPLFEYKDELNFLDFYLINNKYIQTNTSNNGFFQEGITETHYLIPEKKQIDYFLKIEGCYRECQVSDLVQQLKRINQIVTCYHINPSTLKSKNHLIF